MIVASSEKTLNDSPGTRLRRFFSEKNIATAPQAQPMPRSSSAQTLRLKNSMDTSNVNNGNNNVNINISNSGNNSNNNNNGPNNINNNNNGKRPESERVMPPKSPERSLSSKSIRLFSSPERVSPANSKGKNVRPTSIRFIQSFLAYISPPPPSQVVKSENLTDETSDKTYYPTFSGGGSPRSEDDRGNSEIDGRSSGLSDTSEADDCEEVTVNEISWSEITFPQIPSSELILGKGSFGTVIRAIWKHDGKETEVAIKVQSQDTRAKNGLKYFERVRRQARKEASVMILVCQKVHTDGVVRAYGIIEGTLPPAIATLLKKNPEEQSVGIVMRYEGGGSLENKLVGSRFKSKVLYSTREKLRILCGVAKGLMDLHAVGIIHADLKLANIMLSSAASPEPRIADFGMSIIRSEITNSQYGVLKTSTAENTKKTRGTRVYCAPEMLVNPYSKQLLRSTCESETTDMLSTIAKPSRSTDVYAFGILAWTVLAQSRPFTDITSETMLCSRVHQGHRPDMAKVPSDTPNEVKEMIRACWNGDRDCRPTAATCVLILQNQLALFSKETPVILESGRSSTGTPGVDIHDSGLHPTASRDSIHRWLADTFHLQPSISNSTSPNNNNNNGPAPTAKSRVKDKRGDSDANTMATSHSDSSVDYGSIYATQDDSAELTRLSNMAYDQRSSARSTPSSRQRDASSLSHGTGREDWLTWLQAAPVVDPLVDDKQRAKPALSRISSGISPKKINLSHMSSNSQK